MLANQSCRGNENSTTEPSKTVAGYLSQCNPVWTLKHCNPARSPSIHLFRFNCCAVYTHFRYWLLGHNNSTFRWCDASKLTFGSSNRWHGCDADAYSTAAYLDVRCVLVTRPSSEMHSSDDSMYQWLHVALGNPNRGHHDTNQWHWSNVHLRSQNRWNRYYRMTKNRDFGKWMNNKSSCQHSHSPRSMVFLRVYTLIGTFFGVVLAVLAR